MTVQVFEINTLSYDVERCIGCGMCVIVCPHGVFAQNGRVVQVVRPEACIECGACERNCPSMAISVESGPGCAVALIRAALFGGDPTCGPSDGCRGGESSCDSSEGSCGEEGHAGSAGACCGEREDCCSGGEARRGGGSANREGSCCGDAEAKREDGCCGGKSCC